MEDLELKDIWRSYDKKIAEAQVLNAQSWLLNLRCFESIQQQKAQSKLKSLARFKTAAVVLGIFFLLLLGLLIWGNHFVNPYFTISMGAIFLFSLYAIIVYIKHIILIRQLDYDGNIIDTQKKLAGLQSSTFQSTRIMWLQMPFYSTWFWDNKWITETGSKFWLIALPVTVLFTLLAIFLYHNIRVENMHKRWVRSLMMSGPEYKNVVRSMEFLNEIEEFKKELI
ncbi:MAG: hypothetical protein V4539_06130 [Bacteroidota bacterium]